MAEFVGFLSSVAGLVALASQITQISYGYVSDVRDAKRARGQYFTELSAFTDVLLLAEKAAMDAESHRLLSPRPAALSIAVLEDCHNQLVSLRQELRGDGRGGLNRLASALVWPLEEKQLKKHIDMLHRFRSIFADYVAASTLTLTAASYNQLDISSRERERSQSINWLQPSNPPAHSAPPEPPCPGTGNWFLQSEVYVRWRTRAPSLLWCHGKPGVGKSLLSSIVLQDLQTVSASGLVHYFCDFAAGKQQTTTLIIQSLLRQMLIQGNDRHIAVLKRCRDRSSTPPSLKDVFQAFVEMCTLQSPGPYIVLDALDELADRNLLLPLLHELVELGCHIFVTSRHIPDIADALAVSQQVELEANRADLKLFVENELHASDFSHVHGTGTIVDAIVDQASGIFLLARLITNHLLALTTIKEIRRSLAALPSNLNSAYQSSLDRILAQPPARAALALRVIAWITHAERRLTTAELLHALAVEDDTDELDEENFVSTRMVLQVCVGIVLVNEDTSVSLVHATAHKFFQDIPSQFSNTHTDIATTCLRYLCMRTFGTGPCANVVEMDARFQDMPFLSYAAHHWGRHARRVEDSLIRLIHSLLDNACLRASSFQALQYRKRFAPQLAEASFAALPTGQTPLHVVAYWDLGATAQVYIDSEDLSVGDTEGWTALHWASFKGSATVRELLLECGAPINVRDSHHWTPLFWASFNGDIEALTSLLARGADHLVKDISSWTPLQWAVSCRHRSIIEALFKHHASIVARNGTRAPVAASFTVKEARKHCAARSMVPAEIAAETGDADLLDVLLRGISQDGAKTLGFNEAWGRGHFDPRLTNVWRATSKNEQVNGQEAYLRDVQISQSNGTDVREWRSRLLHAAIRDNKIIMASLLLELGAEPNYPVHGRTALHTAAFRKEARFVELLLKSGADSTSLDNFGYTALHQAVMNGFEETTAALVNGGADVNARTDHRLVPRSYDRGRKLFNGTTPLILTCGFRLWRAVDDPALQIPACLAQLLLDAGADATATNESGNAAIHYAVTACNLPLVELLLERGVKIPALPDSAGHSFIHTAVKACDLRLVRLLLQHGASVPPPDPSGYSLIHAFAENESNGKNIDDLRSLLDLLLDKLPAGAESMDWTQSEKVQTVSDTGIRSNSTVETIYCPLSLAMKGGNWDKFTALLERGASLRTTEPLESFLKGAIRELHPGAVNFLLNHGAKLGGEGGDVIDMMRSRNLAQEGDAFAAILNNLIQHGADINSVSVEKYYVGHDKYFGPALLVAAKSVDIPLDIVQALLDVGADPYQTNPDGLDAFILAALHQNVDALSLLLENTTKIPHSDGHWTQPLYSTSLDPSHDSIAYICECLKQHNLIAQRTKIGDHSLLQFAVEAGSPRMVAHLIACGADGDEADSNGWTALHKAIWNGNKAVVDGLLSAGVDAHAATQTWVDSRRKPTGLYEGNSWTGQPLHLAAMVGDAHTARELLQRGADVHASTGSNYFPGHGPTPLHIALDVGLFYCRTGDALDQGRLEIAAMLVDSGADVQGVVERLQVDDVLRFEGFEDLWNKLRMGVTKDGELSD
ncbi:ankyrin repeat-containing domain protein [Mycena polygramma]|nr:ankyrin repeat-containing domain protein [Mycena polygramma]